MAKILGQLETAQFENLAADPALAPTGRVYMNITNPLSAIPKIYDGSLWRTLAWASSSAIPTQNSGKAVVVNWALGTTQTVVLTDNAVISFINPVEGQVHTLQIKQVQTLNVLTTYMYVFDMPDQFVGRGEKGGYQPKPLSRGCERLHQWLYNLNAVPGYATCPATFSKISVNTSPAASINMCVSPKDAFDWAFFCTQTTPFSNALRLFPDPIDAYSNPFGAQITAGIAAAATLLDAVYTPDGKYIFVSSGTTPFIQGYATINGSAGIAFANPATLPTGAGSGIDIHPTGNWVLIGHTTTPFMSCYPITDGAFGAKVADPATLIGNQGRAPRWSPHGDFVAITSSVSPFLYVYPWVINATTGAGTFGAKVADPSVLPTTAATSVFHNNLAWRPQGDFIAYAHGSTYYIVPFNRSTGSFGTALASLPAIASGPPISVEWTPDGQYLILTVFGGVFMYIFEFGSTLFPIAVTLDNAGSISTAGPVGFWMHPSGAWGYMVGANAFKLCYFVPPNKQRNYIRIT